MSVLFRNGICRHDTCKRRWAILPFYLFIFYYNVFGLERLESPQGRVLEERFQELRSVYLCRISRAAGVGGGEREDGRGRRREMGREQFNKRASVRYEMSRSLHLMFNQEREERPWLLFKIVLEPNQQPIQYSRHFLSIREPGGLPEVPKEPSLLPSSNSR